MPTRSAKSRLVIGLMSGTSVDAIDAALVRISTHRGYPRYRADVLAHHEHAWPEMLRERLLAVMAPSETTTEELCELNTLVACEFANAVESLLVHADTKRERITALGSHGQTICHLPPAKSRIKNQKIRNGSTLQLGDPSTLATLTQIQTVGSFRAADMALGGQGAPLVPFADAVLLSHATKTRCIQNIGGIANVTYLPPLSRRSLRFGEQVLAFDTGPGNMLLDAIISLRTNGRLRYDQNGKLAAAGQLNRPLFRSLQCHPYFEQRPPKSTGREDFGLPFARQLQRQIRNQKSKTRIEDVLHTLTRLTAWSIADAYLHFLPALPEEVILCGGGADNPILTTMLAEELSMLKSDFTHPHPPSLRRIDDFGIPNKSKEAASFALLAAATLDGVPANLPSVTGASRPTILGIVARPL